ncbi:hypothetical protein [Actinophytocola sp.]|jgi:hypothetical protein|uniref:hypothetical protein n=1 Tax=Actinophytocola sp. TaxID=1872138 RepID=UPI002D37F931|nr:hypothetical protein [Actinophytocola sp.]HYQ63220.1 hypothetical protein [Actinophytocola sp.]
MTRTKVLKPLAASFALTKSAGGLTVYWSGEWRDSHGLDPVYVNLLAPRPGKLAVARFEFKHRNETGTGYDTTRSEVIAHTPRTEPAGHLDIETVRPLWAVRVVFRRDDAPVWCTKWIYNPYF